MADWVARLEANWEAVLEREAVERASWNVDYVEEGRRMIGLSNLVAEPFDPCCSGCGFEWAWDDLVDGFCPDCVEDDGEGN